MTQLTHSTAPEPEARGFVEEFHGFLGTLRRGWRFIALSVVVCTTIAVFYIAKSKPLYKGSAQVLILHQGGRPLNEVVGSGKDPFRLGEVDDYISTHIMIIRSPMVVERALEASRLKDLRAEEVMDRLTVTRPNPSVKILDIGYQAHDADEATLVIDAVMKSYKKFLEDNYQKNTNDVLKMITRVRDDLSEELKDLEHKYLEFHRQHPVFTVAEDGRSLLARRLDRWDSAANEAMIKGVQLKLQLELGRTLASQGEGLWSIANAMRLMGEGVDTSTLPDDLANAPDGSTEKIGAQLSDLELERRTAQRLLEHLRGEQAAAAAARPVTDQEVERAFAAEPEAARLREQLATARNRLASVRRMVRGGNDPALLQLERRVKTLRDELNQLWQGRRPRIVELLTRGTGEETEDAIRKLESELIVLKAREGVLRERLEALRPGGDSRPGSPAAPKALAHVEAGSGGPSPQGGQVPGPAPSRVLLDSIAQGLKAIETLREEMRRRFDADLAAAKDTEIDRLTEANLRANLERHRAMFNSVVDQLKQAQLVGDYSTITAQTVHPPSASAVRPRMALILGLALVLGCGLGIGFAYLVDLLDARLRTLPEIRRALDLPVLGLIPQLLEDTAAPEEGVGRISQVQPRSMVAEAYRSIRTNLEFQRRRRRVQVLLITSPHSGDGKSTSASNLAISLAHAGRKVLLVDADLRRPAQHVIHGVDRDYGLVHILKSLLPIPEVVRRTGIEDLDLITAGPDVSNPAELLTSPRFVEFLEAARQLYDVVILDSSPLLAVTDPSIIGAAVDGIVVLVRATTIRRYDVQRTIELLDTLGTPILGAVVNGIGREQAGYGYGFGFGYGYGHGNGYGYGQGTYGPSRTPPSLEEPSATPPAHLSNGASEHP